MNNKFRQAAQQALEWFDWLYTGEPAEMGDGQKSEDIRQALRAALAEQPAEKETTMPITDDNGKALRPQYRVVEQRGKWTLLYDQHVLGNTVQHQFRIQKLQHDIVLYPGITLAEAQKRFAEKVEADNE